MFDMGAPVDKLKGSAWGMLGKMKQITTKAKEGVANKLKKKEDPASYPNASIIGSDS